MGNSRWSNKPRLIIENPGGGGGYVLYLNVILNEFSLVDSVGIGGRG